jgi:hypothetical protein
MTTENTRESVLQAAQHLLEHHGRMPTALEVRDHCGRSMREIVPVVVEWLGRQPDPHSPTESAVDADERMTYSQLLKPLTDAIEQLAIRAVNRAIYHGARDAAVGRVVLDSLAAACDEQLGELQILRERVTVSESATSRIHVAAAANECNAARREGELTQRIAFEEARNAIAEKKIEELECAANVADAVAQSRMSELAEAQNAVESHRQRISTISEEQELLRAKIASQGERIGDLTARLAQLRDFEETLTSLCERAADVHEHSARARAQLAKLTGFPTPSLIQPGRRSHNAKHRPAPRTEVVRETG